MSGIFGSSAKAPKLPDPPDPLEIISKQAQTNRINQTTPFGNINFSGPDKTNLEFLLSPEMQELFLQQSKFGRKSGREASALLDRTQFDPVQTQDVSGLQDALFNQGASRLRPLFNERRDRLQNNLEQFGNPATGADLAPGAVSELDVLGRQENDAFSQLAMQAAIAGPQFQRDLLGNDIAAQQANLATPLALGNASPIGVPQFNFQGGTPADVTSAFGLSQQSGIANAQLQQSRNNSLFGGLFDLGSAALGGIFG